MVGREEKAASGHSELTPYCPLCKRTFAKESTRKRHYYYCRSKPSDTNKSRKRSCNACIRAKTRCVRSADAGLEACVRCHARGARCEYDTSVQQAHSPSQGDAGFMPDGTPHEDGELDGRTNNASSALTRTAVESPHVSMTSPSHNVAPTFEFFPDNNWHISSGISANIGPEEVTDPTLNVFSGGSDLLAPNPEAVMPLYLDIPGPSPFEARVVTRPTQAPLISLALRILRSYPFMMLQKGVFLPFTHPLLYSLAQEGGNPPQKALMNCASLVQMFKARTEVNNSFVWRMISLEQERILAEHLEYDRWELLAALQALLIYCLLRARETPVGYQNFDVSLLTTVNVVSQALALTPHESCDLGLPPDPRLAWRDWIFNESRRRTVLIFNIINLLLATSTTVSYYYRAKGRAVLVPLPYNATLWNARDHESWSKAFRRCIDPSVYAVYGVTETGELTRLRGVGGECTAKPAEWEEWSAEVGELGTLVMIVGASLSPE